MNTNVRVSPKHRMMAINYDERVIRLIPHATYHERPKGRYLVMPHHDTEVRILNNLGYNAPSPILSWYNWNDVTPFASQKITAAMLAGNKRAYVLNDMGTGKTMASLFACDFLIRCSEIRKVAIVAPLSTLSTVWENEIFRYFPQYQSVVVHGTRDKRRKLLKTPNIHFFIINHDGVKSVLKELCRMKEIDTVIIDELAVFRNKSTTRWKVLRQFTQGKKYVWGMTGAPTPKAPTDAFGQIKLITPDAIGHYFSHFQDHTMLRLSKFKWVARRNANAYVHSVMQPSVRFTRDQCVDLPPTTYSDRWVDMTADQKKVYTFMQKQFSTMINEGQRITAANAGVQTSKLMQIACGFAYDSQKVAHNVNSAPRIKELKEIIDEAPAKVIVFAPFKHTVEFLAAKLQDDYDLAKIHGDTTKAVRDRVFNEFQRNDNVRVIIAHPKTMSHGLTLTAAATIVWYAPMPDLETTEQANARITRPGQKSQTHVIYICGSPIERKVRKVLEERGNMQAALLQLFEEDL